MKNGKKREFADTSERLFKTEFSIQKKYHLIDPIQQIMMLILTLLLVSAVALMVIKGRRDMAGFIVYFYILRKAIDIFG